MHDGQLDVDDAHAQRLIAREFPHLADAALSRVRGAGTVNAVFRVGEEVSARFPLDRTDAAVLENEASALSAFAAASTVAAPRPVGVGTGDAAYPWAWSLQTWIPGEVADPFRFAASAELADDLAELIRALRRAQVGERVFDGRGRGGELSDHDDWMAHCLSQSTGIVDTDRVATLWGRLRAVPSAGPHVMSHRDLTPANLLVSDGRLAGVLDGGGFGPADRALDLVAAWHLFDAPARARLREAVGASDAEWHRGAAWALQQAMGLVWYYETSNPTMAQLGRSTVSRLLGDQEITG
ncbi:aminoglycoside phosphotransferase family protein [Microbacterium sp. NPDC058345]|uniref:aminoglycoside phosphotransferase family protein n=1 Tax=Microbacterium sp. NPDC058345 TaxID=3346455 RepID=UPI00364A6293